MSDQRKNGGEKVRGPELYDQVQRLLFDWSGQDACVQRAAIAQLVHDILRVVDGHTADTASAAAHDDAEAA